MIRRHRQRAARGWGDPEIWTPDSFPHSLGPNRSIATFNPTYFRRSVTPAGPAIGRGGSDYNTAITLPAASGYTCHLFVLARRSGSVSTLYGGTNAYRINGGAIGSGTPSLLAAATTAISLSQTLTAGSVIFGRWKNTDYLLAHRNAAGIIEWGTSSSSLSDGGPVDIGRASDDAFALIARWVNATPTDAQIRMLLDNPWALLRRSREAVFSAAGGGATSVSADFAGAYALRGAVSADAAAAYAIRSDVAADVAAAYTLRAPVSAAAAASFNVRAAVAADLGAAYEIQATEPVAADLGADYLVRGAVSADAAATYALRGAVSADAGAAYALRTAVATDAACAFVVRGAVAADEVAAYVLRGAVARDLSAAYAVDGSAESVAVISAPRTRGVVPGMTRRAASAGRRPAQRSTSRRPT